MRRKRSAITITYSWICALTCAVKQCCLYLFEINYQLYMVFQIKYFRSYTLLNSIETKKINKNFKNSFHDLDFKKDPKFYYYFSVVCSYQIINLENLIIPFISEPKFHIRIISDNVYFGFSENKTILLNLQVTFTVR